jgi:hypothetical protein
MRKAELLTFVIQNIRGASSQATDDNLKRYIGMALRKRYSVYCHTGGNGHDMALLFAAICASACRVG